MNDYGLGTPKSRFNSYRLVAWHYVAQLKNQEKMVATILEPIILGYLLSHLGGFSLSPNWKDYKD